MQNSIYLDNAATTPLHSKAFQKMQPYLLGAFGNADSPHALGRQAAAAVDTARDTVAAALHAKPSEIYFTSGGTEADNWAILGGARAAKKHGKTHILISSIEHHASLFAAQTLDLEGFEVEYLPVGKEGRVQAEEVKARLRETTALVCVMAVNNETGIRQPIEEIAAAVKHSGALLFVDAVQAYPHETIDVKGWGVDMLSISSHKIFGPKGVGALYIKSGVKIDKLVGGGEQERGLRGGTLNVAAIVGFGEAVRLLEENRAQTKQTVETLCSRFLKGIAELGVLQNGEPAYRAAPILNLRIPGVENATLLYRADLEGLMIAAGSACSSASVKPSHVLTAMGLTEKEAKESVRISFGAQNTAEEIDNAVKIFTKIVKDLRR